MTLVDYCNMLEEVAIIISHRDVVSSTPQTNSAINANQPNTATGDIK